MWTEGRKESEKSALAEVWVSSCCASKTAGVRAAEVISAM